MKKIFVIVIIAAICVSLAACHRLDWINQPDNLDNPDFDISLPNFAELGLGAENANEEGWYTVFVEDFDGDTINTDLWDYSPHGLRRPSDYENKPENDTFWCPSMVSVSGGELKIKSSQGAQCEQGICSHNARFSGGIETRRASVNNQGAITPVEDIFSQAFGYYEARVKFPKEEGVWSAFWLQSNTQGQMGNGGEDGTEIDIYESAFIRNPKRMGHALLWDGYAAGSQVKGYLNDFPNITKNFYDGYHTFALKWTPWYYIFYIDGVATWATDAGGVSKVPAFVRLTVEIDCGDKYGPHGAKIGAFKGKGSEFCVDYVKVYQNINWKPYERQPSDFI